MSENNRTGSVRIPRTLSHDVNAFFSALKLGFLEDAAQRALQKSGGDGESCFVGKEDLIDAARVKFAAAADEFARALSRESGHVRKAAS